MDPFELKAFLWSSAQCGYASGNNDIQVKESDGSTSITIEDGPWKSHDNWIGGEPYGGRIIVSYEGKPVWFMGYYGSTEEGTVANEIYAFLMESLKRMPKCAPLRGPGMYLDETLEWYYENTWVGNVPSFSGTETIYFKDKMVYRAYYRGGLANTRPDG